MTRLLILLCAVFCLQSAHAAKLVDFTRSGLTQSGRTAKVGMTGNGTEFSTMIPIPKQAGGWQSAANYGIPNQPIGPTMTMNASGDVFFAGTKYPFQAGYTVPASSLAGSLVSLAGSFAGGPLGLGLAIAGGAMPFVLDWLHSAGGRIKPDGSIERADPTVCTVAPCFEYRYSAGAAVTLWFSTKNAACVALGPAQTAVSALDWQDRLLANGDCRTAWRNRGSSGAFTDSGFGSLETRSASPSGPVFLPSSMDDIAPYMTPRSFDPRALPELLDKGADIPMPAPVVTGPTSIDGPVTSTTNPDGTRTDTKTTYHFQTSGDTITNTSNVTNTTTYNIDNSVQSTTTTTTEPTEQDDSPAVDSPLPDQPKLYERKYPDGLVGVWNDKKTELLDTPLLALTSSLQPTIAGDGGYPSFVVPVVMGPWNFGSYEVSPAPFVWDFLKVCVIVTTLFLARALIFGG